MDEKDFGQEDARGHWAPTKPIGYGPAFDWPPDPKRLVQWLFGFPGYFLPWNLFYAAMALVLWTWFSPSLDTTKELAPGWIAYLRHYCGEEKSYVEGLYIDESMVSVRRSGGHHPVHSGGYQAALRGGYHYAHGVFRAGQCNIILALTDIGPGDGATMVIPGSHKSNFPHPHAGDYAALDRMDHLDGAEPVYLEKGDALLFVDGLMHGGSSRTNPGERRVTIYRYGPLWGASRFGFSYSAELLDRLPPERRKILQPVAPLTPPR